MKESVVDKETAEAEFNRFAEMMDLDLDVTTMDEDDKRGFESQKSKVVNAIQSGALVINDQGEPVFTPQSLDDAEPITFYEPTGATFMAMDKRKKNEDMGKMMSMLGDATKTHPSTFSRMKNRDFRVCQALLSLFLT